MTEEIAKRMAAAWEGVSPKSLANSLSAPLYGTPGEWDLPQDVVPKKDLLYLAVGIPDTPSLPKEALADAAAKVITKPGDIALRYGFGQGPEGIRAWLAEHRSQLEQFAVTPDWFQMTNGSSGAIDLVVRSLINPGDVIIAENPTYMGTLHNFRGVGAEMRYVPIDDEGLNTDALEELLITLKQAGKTVKLIYTISAFQNPSGAVLSTARREKLLGLAAAHNVLVLDDEAYRELWIEHPPPRALSATAGGWGVITVGSFSKTVATGIRVGYIHARPELLALFARMRFAMGQNQFGLRTFGEFLADGHYPQHVKKMRAIYQHKRDLLHQAMQQVGLDQYLEWRIPAGGFYFWAKLKPGIERESLWRTAIHEGIAVNNGRGFAPDGESEHVRIAYAWTPESDFAEAAHRLRIACERVVSGDSV